MNTEERAEAAFRAAIRECAGVCHGDMEKAFAIIAAAIREERERCAKVADQEREDRDADGAKCKAAGDVGKFLAHDFAALSAEAIAAAIRSQP